MFAFTSTEEDRMRFSNLFFGGACLAASAVFAGGASGTTITFSGLTGANGAVLAPYTEGGFTVTPTVGTWFEAHLFGNPVPSIVAGGVFGGPVTDAFSVTEGGSSFTFAALDISPFASDANYTFTGTLSGAPVFTVSGTALSAPAVFTTILSGVAGDVINDLVVSTTLTNITGLDSVNIDNIVVSAAVAATPEPTTLGILGTGLGLMGLFCYRRRQRVVSTGI
jgi:hypothetical protein